MDYTLRYELSLRLIFQKESQRTDILSTTKTTDNLCSMLYHLVYDHGLYILVTALVSDHHDDGPGHSHAAGRAVDVWFNKSNNALDYHDANDAAFVAQLVLAKGACLSWGNASWPIGLGGSANTLKAQQALGRFWFPDSAADHVHLCV